MCWSRPEPGAETAEFLDNLDYEKVGELLVKSHDLDQDAITWDDIKDAWVDATLRQEWGAVRTLERMFFAQQNELGTEDIPREMLVELAKSPEGIKNALVAALA